MASEGESMAVLRRTLAGYARHPNFYAVLIVGLGCETNQIDDLVAAEHLDRSAQLSTMTIQQTGGTARTIAAGIERVRALLSEANRVTREPVDARHLMVGLQCGGSDGYSGISANPALGSAVDRLVSHCGTAILSETPEIYGAEHLLTRRAASREVGEKLLARIRWWEAYCSRMQANMNNNPSAGNKAGGLTTILEKIARRSRERRHHAARPDLRIRAARARARPRVHGYAGLRSGIRHGPGSRWSQSDLLHDRARLGLRLCAGAIAEARHQ